MSWEKVNINDICRPRQWKTLSTEKLSENGYPVYGANGKIGCYSEYTHEFPTLAITCRGATCGSVHITEPKSYINGNAMALDDISNEVDIQFLFYYFRSRGFNDVISGSAQPQITGQGLSKVQIPLPPLPIQKRIAEILDAANALKRKDQELLKKYDELAQAIFIDMFGDPVRNEKGWEMKTLKSCANKIGSGATPTGGKTAYKQSGISLIRSMNVYDFSFKWKDLAFIDYKQASKLNNVEVKPKDVLFNITGASVCRCSIVPEKVLPARVNQHVAIIRTNSQILNPVFLNHLLVSERVKNKLLGVGAGGGAVMEAITKDQLENFNLIVPPIEIQNRFENLINLVFGKKTLQITSNQYAENLFNSLIQKAFNGELVA